MVFVRRLLEALEVRFGAVPEAVRKKVEALQEEAALKRAMRAALTAETLQAFDDQL